MKYLRLFEKLKICDYKQWSKFFNKEIYDKLEPIFRLFKDHDKKYNRVYIPLGDIDVDNWEIKIPDELSDYLNWYHYYNIDFLNGLVDDQDGRRIKIGKLLKREGQDDLLKN